MCDIVKTESLPVVVKSEQHIHEYDVLKMLTLFFVVVGHSGYLAWSSNVGQMDYSYATNFLAPRSSLLFGLLNSIINWIYTFHMPLFFMLSGAVYNVTKSHYENFEALVISKCKRLLIPFISIGVFVMIPIKMLTGFYEFSFGSYIHVVFSFLTTGAFDRGQLWFLLCLFWVFILFYPFERFVVRKNKVIGVFTVVIYGWVITCSTVGTVVLENVRGFPLFDIRSLWFLVYFSIGYFFEFVRTRLNKALLRNAFLCFCGLGVLTFFTFLNFNPQQILGHYLSIGMIVSCAFIYHVSLILSYKIKVVQTRMYFILKSNMMNAFLYHDQLNFVVLTMFANIFGFSIFKSFSQLLIYIIIRTFGVAIIAMLLGKLIGYAITLLKKRISTKQEI